VDVKRSIGVFLSPDGGISPPIFRSILGAACSWPIPPRLLWPGRAGPGAPLRRQTVGTDEFAAFMRRRGFDRGSHFANPKFVDAGGHDYRLAPDSPARTPNDHGQPAGALLE
jgi:hypothetical protein